MSDSDEIAHLQRLLKIYQRNLQILEGQAGSLGGEHLASVALQNQLFDTRDKIAELEAKLNVRAVEGGAPAGARVSDPTSAVSPAIPSAPSPVVVTLYFQTRPEGALITWRSPGIGSEESLF